MNKSAQFKINFQGIPPKRVVILYVLELFQVLKWLAYHCCSKTILIVKEAHVNKIKNGINCYIQQISRNYVPLDANEHKQQKKRVGRVPFIKLNWKKCKGFYVNIHSNLWDSASCKCNLRTEWFYILQINEIWLPLNSKG